MLTVDDGPPSFNAPEVLSRSGWANSFRLGILDASAATRDFVLRDTPGAATQSIGEEPNRRVVVPARNV